MRALTKNLLILGGARSGKTRRALAFVEQAQLEPVYLATAQAGDDEMAARIAHHKSERGPLWRTIEEPLDLVEVLENEACAQSIILVDCLTLWLSNVMHTRRDVESEIAKLCAALPFFAGPIVLVSNEVGLGLVPETPLGRAFRDHQGRLNQAVAAICERVEFIAAGLAIPLKG